jgi:phosphinothricin acetyltransferase
MIAGRCYTAAMLVVDATLNDLPRIVAIYNQNIASRMVTADLEPVTVEGRRAWFAAHAPTHRPLWVARETETGAIIAWLSFQSFYGRRAYDGSAEVSVYVDASFRRSGIGRRLLERAMDLAPSLGIRNLLGFIFGHNIPSLILFERLGFARWGTLPRVAVLDGFERDLVILGKRIEASGIVGV